MQNLIKRQYEKFNIDKKFDFGRLTPTGRSYIKFINGKYVRFIEAECSCPAHTVRGYRYELLITGQTKSCGCLRREVAAKSLTTHGLSKHRLYDVWWQMVLRCTNPKNKGFHNYGGRGICVCDEWLNNFVSFYNWAIENGWQKGLELDRRQNDGHYEPLNCHFVTKPVNSRNKRSTRLLTAWGETKCMKEWSRDSRCLIPFAALRARIDVQGWTDYEKAMTAPYEDRKTIQRRNKRAQQYTAFGETKCMSAWLEDERCLVKIDSFRTRVREGWDAEKIMTTPPTVGRPKGSKDKKRLLRKPV